MKNVLVINSSLRAKSTSRELSNEMIKGLLINNHVEQINLKEINFGFCKGCLSCQKTGKCVINDDIQTVIEKVKSADVLIFVTPIYYYSISGQLKTFLDRMNPLYIAKDRHFKEVYALFTCADDNVSAIEGPLKAIEGWIECFDGVKFVSSFNGLGLNSIQDITDKNKSDALNFGKNIK